MRALNLLGIPLARLALIRLEMTRVSAPIVGMISRDPKGLQQGFELQKRVIFAPPKDMR